MGLLTFKGGVHPNDGKSLAKDKAIVELLPQGDLVYPLSQHIGAPAKPVVAKGDHVLKGQKIAEAGGFVSAPIYASVSGTVKAIEPRVNPTGSKVNSIIIANDGQYEEVEYPQPKPLSELTKEEILNIIGEAGVVGMGGAGFPTRVKLSPKEPDKIDYIIANCAECEPYITADYRRMLENPELLVEGMRVILKLFDNAKGLFAIEDNKPDCIAKLKELTKDEPRMEVREMMTKYPQGAERQLIFANTGRAINSTMLPADVGCVVDNVETVTSVYKAVILGQPVISRNVTVTGDGIRTPKNFSVLTGTDLSELVDAAGGLKEKIAKAISGGPMMGFALYDLHIPCTKTTSSLLFLERDAVSEAKQIQTACINCGRCVSVCPGHVVPARLATLAEHGDMAGFEKMDGMECCRRLKSEVQTSHIPVMMLTAYTMDEQKVMGYECGADSYILKPFSARLLLVRLRNLIDNRRRLQSFFADKTSLRKEPIADLDKGFVEKLRTLIEEQLGNSELSVEDLGDKIGMSRVQLYRKAKALTGYSPNELLRIARLKKAASLLASTEKTVAEITYEVGFSSPSYFTKCYKDYFGESPTDFLKRKG